MTVIRLFVGKKFVGEIDTAARVWRKQVVGSKHFLQIPPAIAVDADLYDRYRDKFDVLEVEDMETGRVYRVSATRFDYFRFVIDRGHGRQYALPLSRWARDDSSVEAKQLRLEGLL